MTRSLFSYVVRYDSGFAPNPFHGYCTLATCKPLIRKHASVGDWLVGTGSNGAPARRGGYLVYAMRVTEVLETAQYWQDPRFQRKKPDMYHNWVAASGDNIYEPIGGTKWKQHNSYHSNQDGSSNAKHMKRDTGVQRVLVSDDFVYYGGEGPRLSKKFLSGGGMNLCHAGRNYRRVQDETVIAGFEAWLRSQGHGGYEGTPGDWIHRRR